MDLSIIIVNWNSVEYLQNCLKSIYATTRDISFEVIVIDNASFDGSGEMIPKAFPAIRFIQSEENVGFARANNLGYAASCGDMLLFLNPDTEVIGPAIQTMYRFLTDFIDCGAVGCKLLNTDGSVQTSCVQAFPTILNQVLDAEVLRRRFPKLKLWGTEALLGRNKRSVPVDVVSGACIMIKRKVFYAIGMFSTDYFMYAEDVDLCYKVKTAGYIVYYNAAVEVLHHGGGSSRQRSKDYFAVLVMRESIQRFLHKSKGRAYGLLYRFSTGGAALCRIMVISLLLGSKGIATGREDLKISLGKWVRIFRWSLGFEAWTQRLTHEKSTA